MSHGAKALYVVLKIYYGPRERNNGKVVLPIRRAAQELGRSAHEDVVRWFRELQHFGFIVLKGENKERRCCQWRLTELGYMREQPTREFGPLGRHALRKENRAVTEQWGIVRSKVCEYDGKGCRAYVATGARRLDAAIPSQRRA